MLMSSDPDLREDAHIGANHGFAAFVGDRPGDAAGPDQVDLDILDPLAVGQRNLAALTTGFPVAVLAVRVAGAARMRGRTRSTPGAG